jgi:hypothetical protein
MQVDAMNAGQHHQSGQRRNRLAASIAALAGVASLLCSPAKAQTMTWGVFQENLAPSAANYPGNCWSQAMVSGGAINGRLLQGQMTQQQAQTFLATAISQGTCMNQPD